MIIQRPGTGFAFLIILFLFVVVYYAGRRHERRHIANAVRTGKLSVTQRVESIAVQIESGVYKPVGEP